MIGDYQSLNMLSDICICYLVFKARSCLENVHLEQNSFASTKPVVNLTGRWFFPHEFLLA